MLFNLCLLFSVSFSYVTSNLFEGWIRIVVIVIVTIMVVFSSVIKHHLSRSFFFFLCELRLPHIGLGVSAGCQGLSAADIRAARRQWPRFSLVVGCSTYYFYQIFFICLTQLQWRLECGGYNSRNCICLLVLEGKCEHIITWNGSGFVLFTSPLIYFCLCVFVSHPITSTLLSAVFGSFRGNSCFCLFF